MNHKKPNLLLTILILISLGFTSSCAHTPEDTGDKIELLIKKANVEYNNNQLNSAKALYIKALELEAYQPSIYYRLGNIAYKQNEMLEAKDWYLKCLKIKPSYIKAHHNLSIVYLTLAKPHIDYFNANANKKNIDQRLIEISEIINFRSNTLSDAPTYSD